MLAALALAGRGLAAPAGELSVALGAESQAELEKLSRFERTVLYVQSAELPVRADFARTALKELESALSAEVDLVEGELEDSARASKLRGWAAAVRQYQRELALLRADIEQGYEVQLAPGGGGLEVRVDRRTIIASHPRPGHQALLEQAILARFCAVHDCEEHTAPPQPQDSTPIPVSRADVRPTWNFGPDGPVCEHRNLALHFADTAGLARYRLLCEQFLHESVRLVDEIAWQQRHEVAVDWSGLTVSAVPGRPEHVVHLNGAGDSILITIPLIQGTEGLLALLLPWLRAEVAQEAYSLELRAADLGWEAAQPGN